MATVREHGSATRREAREAVRVETYKDGHRLRWTDNGGRTPVASCEQRAMNKTVALYAIGGLAALGLSGAVVPHILRPHASATLISQLQTILGLVIVASGLSVGINKVVEKVETVQKQTNGSLSKKDAEIARLTQKLIDDGLDPEIPAGDI